VAAERRFFISKTERGAVRKFFERGQHGEGDKKTVFLPLLSNSSRDPPNQKEWKTDDTDEPNLNGLFFSGFFKKSV